MSALGCYNLLLTSADPKKKKKKNWQRPVKEKKIPLFSFVCLFILFAIFKKKKKRKLALTSKRKKKEEEEVGFTF